MAITINQQPYQYLNLSGNPMTWTFSSTNTGLINFSFYIELFINGALDSTHEVVPESGINGKFDASIYAENNTEAPQLGVDLSGVDSQSTCTVQIKVYEKYGATATVQTGTIQASTTVVAVKGKKEINDWIEFLDVDDQYIFETTNPARWLTEDTLFKIREGETIYQSLLCNNDTPTFFTVLDYYDSAGTNLDTVTDVSPGSGRLVNFAISYTELESSYGGAGTFADVAYVTFQARTATAETTDLYRIDIDRTCRLDAIQVHFLSQLGNIDSFTFERQNRTSLSLESKNFTTSQGEWDGSGFSFDGTNVNTKTFQTMSNKKMTLRSEWLSEQKQEFLLNNLVLSPLILIRTSSGLRRVANGSASFQFNKKPFDTLFNLEMTVDLGRHSSMII